MKYFERSNDACMYLTRTASQKTHTMAPIYPVLYVTVYAEIGHVSVKF